MSNIFIPAGVRDKAMRDTLIAIVRELGNVSGRVSVVTEDPVADTSGVKGDVIYAESSGSIWVFSNDSNWVLVAGISTVQAAEGYTGDSRFTGTLYYQTIQSAQPSAPSAATWSIPNNDFSSISPAGDWSLTQPPVTVTDTSFREWSTNYTVVLDTTTTPISSSIVFTTPTGAIQITDDLESDNYTPGTSGWTINRNTGNAEFGSASIRGTLTAAQIGAGTINADKLSAASISALGLTIGTLSSAATGERTVISDTGVTVYDSSNVVRVKLGNLT
jgi:hypothetical protein